MYSSSASWANSLGQLEPLGIYAFIVVDEADKFRVGGRNSLIERSGFTGLSHEQTANRQFAVLDKGGYDLSCVVSGVVVHYYNCQCHRGWYDGLFDTAKTLQQQRRAVVGGYDQIELQGSSTVL